jgi:hypothetical protein
MLCIHLHVLFVHKFHEELILFVTFVKKTKFGAKNKPCTRYFLVFFTHQTKKCWFSTKFNIYDKQFCSDFF